jgi:hypothetical protein
MQEMPEGIRRSVWAKDFGLSGEVDVLPRSEEKCNGYLYTE